MKTSFQVETLDRWFQHRMLEVHTCIPCKVLSYDASKQTVDVHPEISHYLLNSNNTREAEALPDLFNVPVAFPRAGGYHISLPITVNDYVLVICSDEPTQAWRTKARDVEPGILDRHGLNGVFAIPCGFPDKEKLSTAPPTDAIEIAKNDGSAAVLVKDGTVLLGDSTATEFASLDSKVQDELQKLSDRVAVFERVFAAWSPVAMDGGAALKTAYGMDPGTPGAAPGATAASKTKVK